MSFRELLRFDLADRLRRPSTWIYALLFLGFGLLAAATFVDDARREGFPLDAPIVPAGVMVMASMLGLLVAAALAGEAATRDAECRLTPLLHTAPVGRNAYLGARFLAAFALQALLLAAAAAGGAAIGLVPGIEPGLAGPPRAAAHLDAYLLLGLPNVLMATALLFAAAALTRRALAAFVGAGLLFVLFLFAGELATTWGRWELGRLLDPFAFLVVRSLFRGWSAAEKAAGTLDLGGALLANRLLWVGVALAALAATRLRWPFGAEGGERRRGWRGRTGRRRREGRLAAPPAPPLTAAPVRRSFGRTARLRQAGAVARDSLGAIATSRGAFAFALPALFLVLVGPELMEHMGVPLVPVTALLLDLLADPEIRVFTLLPAFLAMVYAGELVWREREARADALTDTAPVPEWVLLAGKLAALVVALVAMQALVVAAGVAVQAMLGHHRFELGLSLVSMLGLELVRPLLLAVLAVALHVVATNKLVGHVAALLAFVCTSFAGALGVEHGLLVYATGPAWSVSDLRGFGGSLAPFLWFQLAWAGVTLVVAVAARLLWVRGSERRLRPRLRLARRRLGRWSALTAAAGAAVALGAGGYVLDNTHRRHDYRGAGERAERRAEYERRYGRFEGAPQPTLAGVRLHVDLHPERRRATVRGSYRLENDTAAPIDTVHLAPAWGVETRHLRFDRAARPRLVDRDLRHHVYDLDEPLRPGEALRLDFEVRHAPRGFTHRGADDAVAAGGTWVMAHEWLPAIGYQAGREISNAGERRAHGLPPRPAVRPLDDAAARADLAGREAVAFEAVVLTAADEIALAPGTLRRTWTAGGRRGFHYVAERPIRNVYSIASGRYAVRRARWRDVEIEALHHPDHAHGVERLIAGARASLDHFTETYGPYPFAHLRLVEVPGWDGWAISLPGIVAYSEGLALMDAAADPRRVDFPFAVVAHETAHQWWGHQLVPADVEGATLLTESLSWSGALAVVERTHGEDHLRRLVEVMREAYLAPRPRADVPLLRAGGWFLGYRKGALAMYSLRETIGAERVDRALRRLLAEHGAGAPPLPTSRDLYRHLAAVTPAEHRQLLADLFAHNTYWELAAREARAEPAAEGGWRVSFEVTARKLVVDEAGRETEVAMDQEVEIGVHGAAASAAAGGGEPGEAAPPLALRRQRLRSGVQRVEILVPRRPARVVLDPHHLLIEIETRDNAADL
jgi:ABC-2 type transport system permease protein